MRDLARGGMEKRGFGMAGEILTLQLSRDFVTSRRPFWMTSSGLKSYVKSSIVS